MRTCETCGVRVLGTAERCPLCQCPLTGTGDPHEDVYPVIPLSGKPRRTLIRVFALVTVVLAVLCGAVYLCWPWLRVAALSTVGGLASGWLTVGLALRKTAPLKAVFRQVCVLSLLVLIWDWATGFLGWSLDYVLPILYTCTLVTMAVLALSLRLRASDYLLYLGMNILLGLIPLGLLLGGVLKVPYPAVICAAVSLIILAALVLFQGRSLGQELHRRLHL